MPANQIRACQIQQVCSNFSAEVQTVSEQNVGPQAWHLMRQGSPATPLSDKELPTDIIHWWHVKMKRRLSGCSVMATVKRLESKH